MTEEKTAHAPYPRLLVLSLGTYFDYALKKMNNVFVCHFFPNGIITFLNYACRKFLGGEKGQNFIPMLPLREQKRVERHLKSYTFNMSIRSHIEDTGMYKVRWINRAVFNNNKIIKFESVGWILQTDDAAENQKREMLITV